LDLKGEKRFKKQKRAGSVTRVDEMDTDALDVNQARLAFRKMSN
jgi:hypothetical protein